MNRKLLFIISCLVLITQKSYSLTNGPTQPEYQSFESIEVTDMVDLPTGDFVYVLPLGEVKTPGGIGYPISLHYQAGIRNDIG